MTPGGTPFSFETDSTTSRTSLLILRLVFAILGIRGLALKSLETGNDVGLVDHLDGQQILMLVHLHHDVLVFHTAQQTLEITSPFEGRPKFDLDLFTGVGSELLQREQRSIHTGGRHLEGVFIGDGIFHIEYATYLATDGLAIFDENAVGMIDIDTQ